ncbi:unnamed protein product [Ambrosiozyma monospora]|uniref:Unnamed protein product n=1 Tax=Ambrosiozyma monospora TaxID=43982 RepID=A0ACB5TT82_AMBMO|nr:unnamed protein product [Ambrosiozyma monospora]
MSTLSQIFQINNSFAANIATATDVLGDTDFESVYSVDEFTVPDSQEKDTSRIVFKLQDRAYRNNSFKKPKMKSYLEPTTPAVEDDDQLLSEILTNSSKVLDDIPLEDEWSSMIMKELSCGIDATKEDEPATSVEDTTDVDTLCMSLEGFFPARI